MILFENSIIKLNYDPSTDILEIQYPDLKDYLLPEIKHSIDVMVDIIKNYDIKRLLLDSTKTTSSVTEEQSRDIATYLATGIAKTRVEQVARLQSPVPETEERAQKNIQKLHQTMEMPFQLLNFTDKILALNWLQGKQ